MSTEIFKILGTIAIDNANANKAIDATTGKAEQSESKITSAAKKIGAAVVTYFAIDKVVGFGKACVESAATVQAQAAQFEAAFKDLQGTANKAFSKMAEDTGVLATRLKTVGTQGFSQFKGAGLEAAEALKKTDKFTRLAADGAAYYDMSLEETSELMRSFIRGNTEAGDRIGLFTSETQRNQAALDTLGKKYIACTEAEKQMIMLDIANTIYKSSGAMGQASREADGYENVVGNLKEAWRLFQAEVGKPLLEKAIPVIKKLAEMIAYLKDNTEEITHRLKQLTPIVVGAASAFIGLKTSLAITKSMSAVSSAAKVLDKMMQANALTTVTVNGGLTAMQSIAGVLTGKITLLTVAQGLFNKALIATPWGAILTAVVAVGVGLAAYGAIVSLRESDQYKLSKSIKDTSDKLEENAKAYDELKQARDEQASSAMIEIDYLAGLKTELDGLVDANGKVKESDEARVNFILGELSAASGVAVSLIDNEIKGYKDASIAIDAYIEKQRVAIAVEIEMAELKALLKQQKKDKKLVETAIKNTEKAKENYDNAPKGGSPAQAAIRRKAKVQLDDARKTEKEAAVTASNNAIAFAKSEKILGEARAGEYGKLNALYTTNVANYADMNKKTKKELEDSVLDLKANIEINEQAYRKTNDVKYKDKIDANKKTLTSVQDHISSISKANKNALTGHVADFRKADESTTTTTKKANTSRVLDFAQTASGIQTSTNVEGAKLSASFGVIGNNANTALKNPFKGTGEWFKTTFDNVVGGIKDAFKGIGNWASGVWDGIKKQFGGGDGGISVSYKGDGGGGVSPTTSRGIGSLSSKGNGIDFYKLSGMNGPKVHAGRKAADYPAPRNTPIPSLQNGTIADVQVLSTKDKDPKGSYGRNVTVASGGKRFVYAHMNKFSSLAKIGQRVTRGQTIGYVGASGNTRGATGLHLHYGIRGFKTGGSPENGELFRANEESIEMMGKVGKKNVVANNIQIVDMVTAAVSSGMHHALKQANTTTKQPKNKDSDNIIALLKLILQHLQSDTNIKVNEREFGRLVRSVNA